MVTQSFQGIDRKEGPSNLSAFQEDIRRCVEIESIIFALQQPLTWSEIINLQSQSHQEEVSNGN